MLLTKVQQMQISKTHNLWKYCDDICFSSKNLYNYANYIIRQEFITNGKWIRYYELNNLCKDTNDYRALPAQTSQQVLKLLDKNWVSFFGSIKKYSKDKKLFLGMPKLPKYKHKTNGRNITIFTNQQCRIKDCFIKFPKTKIGIKTTITDKLKQVRIVPNSNYYTIEIVYEIEIPELLGNNGRLASIDLGLNNLVTLTNNIGNNPIIINGKIIKSINQYYNRELSKLKSIAKKQNNVNTTKRIQRLTRKRNNKIKDLLHKTSKFVVKYLKENNISTLVIGYNQNWKQEIDIGKRNNQNFVQIPYLTFINQLRYKCLQEGLECIVTEESYTSKASFIDLDDMDCKTKFSGKRIKRGLYESKNETRINADVNGSYNIMRKAFPNAYADGIEGVVFHPIKLCVV